MNHTFPFTAVCAQEDFKLCLVLCLVDPALGGVLALGDKGTGKTTTVRGLSQLMKHADEKFSFVNLPIGAAEDRVLGSVKLDVLISERKLEVEKGLLNAAHNGVLYIDEVNLLNDYLMDVLLDAASSGGYYLERDGISAWLESRFCLVGTMNPEEGELRPQLLDRFGLSVVVKTPQDRSVRTEIMRRRMAFDTDPSGFATTFHEEEKELSEKIATARKLLAEVIVPDFIYEEIAQICIDNEVEGLRADILIMKGARAHAAFQSRKAVRREDVDVVLPYVIAHRSKKYSHNQTSRRNSEQPSHREEKEGDSKRVLIM